MGRKISDGGDRGTPGYRRGRQESFRARRLEMLWIWKVFGFGDKFRGRAVPDTFARRNPSPYAFFS